MPYATIRSEESGARLRELRERKGLSQQMLADRISVSRQTITKWESGKAFPQWRTLPVLAELYDVSIVYLRTGQSEVHDPRRKDA